MKKQALATITEYNMFAPGDGVVLGLSGGADSIALLHFLHNLDMPGLKIAAVHINHGLRGDEANEDAVFCEKICQKYNINVVVFDKNVAELAAETGLGIEQAGRQARYDCFHQALTQLGYNKIAVAHNKNDVAETVLMNIFRGAGGVKGIPAVNGTVVRPLINVGRDEILAYCADNGLEFRTDSTNDQNNYTRNKVRNIFLPMAREVNFAAVDALVRLAGISADEDSFLDNITKNVYKKCVNNGEIDIKLLDEHDIAIKRRVIRMALAEAFGGLMDINNNHVEAVLGLFGKENGKRAVLPRSIVAEKIYHKICIKIAGSVQEFSVILPKNIPIYVAQAGKWFYLGKNPPQENAFTMALDCGKIDGVQVKVRTRLPGDRIFFDAVGTKKIKDYFSDKKVPRHLRDRAVFVAADGDVICMMDGPKSQKFSPETRAGSMFLQIWEEEG